SAGGRGGESPRVPPNWAAAGPAASVAPITTKSAAIRAMSDVLVQLFAFVRWPCFAQAPVNMWNAAKTGAPDGRTEAIDRLLTAYGLITDRPESRPCNLRSPLVGDFALALNRSVGVRRAYRSGWARAASPSGKILPFRGSGAYPRYDAASHASSAGPKM